MHRNHTPTPEHPSPSFFVARHLGAGAPELEQMRRAVEASTLEPLAGPAGLAGDDHEGLELPPAGSERELLEELRRIAAENRVVTSMIGLGYHDTITPAVLRRSILENPAWYTAYTPYQAEISQGRLEALLVFQTLVADLTGLPVANASLLDESTAVVEAMLMCQRALPGRRRFVVDRDCLPQTIAVLGTRARPLGVELVVADLDDGLPEVEDAFGIVVQYPGASGRLPEIAPLLDAAHGRGWRAVVAADPLALTLLTPPGELGADVVVGSMQRFGMPLGFGGPHAGYLATTAQLERSVPGRIVGVSRDSAGNRALQLALQTREQHIRRERATSNICTAEVLPAVVAAMFAVHHGPEGLATIAERVHGFASRLACELEGIGHEVLHDRFFDTIEVRLGTGSAGEVLRAALELGINLRAVGDDVVAVACDETTTRRDLDRVVAAFGQGTPGDRTVLEPDGAAAALAAVGRFADLPRRTGPFLTHEAFHRYRSEAALTRLLRRLSDLDLALDRTMIPLGSCTMKLNAAIEMEPISWPELAQLHPFAPASQTEGTRRIIADLAEWLGRLTGFEAVSLQPNAGSQGELAGLLAIRSYHLANGEPGRDVCLVPSSAHGTNPASATLAGMRVVVVACDASGNVDLEDLDAKLAGHRDDLAALMITYPSTSGVYEPAIRTICERVHEAGGQVYLDGANFNALAGFVRPGSLGADASHLNLHKTFCIPHGGGGPGVGPVAVKAHLAPYLPNHPLRDDAGPPTGPGPFTGAPFGSAGILVIPWAYIRLMGSDGLRLATQAAVLAANYLAEQLAPFYPVLYRGEDGHVAHECIVDLRPFAKSAGIHAEDVAKRLIDYGFHAPTMHFPVAGTLMIEPTESESLEELDRFVQALVSIRAEIEDVAMGELPRDDNPLRHAPHTAEELAGEWAHPYSRERAAYPLASMRASEGFVKYWPPVKRVDVAYGDRHLCCAFPRVEDVEAGAAMTQALR
ncbi:MAG TPA: aminomethyl-transferring glycine dehydrogenase [Acidimicrobiales bacterium]|nr:aminomethyl-transferring glycine dehydrogenase [Acidimicrobiales bacterium]